MSKSNTLPPLLRILSSIDNQETRHKAMMDLPTGFPSVSLVKSSAAFTLMLTGLDESSLPAVAGAAAQAQSEKQEFCHH
jgi:hypothetical protein